MKKVTAIVFFTNGEHEVIEEDMGLALRNLVANSVDMVYIPKNKQEVEWAIDYYGKK